MDYSKKQTELDIQKWIDSETKSYDTCGEYSYCCKCNKSESYPCACAYEKFYGCTTDNAYQTSTTSTTTKTKRTCTRKTSTSKSTTTKSKTPTTKKTTTRKTTTKKSTENKKRLPCQATPFPFSVT